MGKCGNCGCTQTARNDARGETVCTNCGAVLAESEMVDQLTFGSGGKMNGQFIDSMTGGTRGFAALYSRRESSEASLASGWNNLERVASRLNMPQSIVNSSKRLYHLAFQRNFTLGRNNYYVVSACLYAVSRREKAANLLIDFSDALLTPVKTLAQVFMKLVRALTLEIPTVDPSLFMERFANEMSLGAKASLVAQTGVRLVQVMTREWLVTGRRPLGLCAASLLIAARYHGVKLNAEDINVIFRCSPSTIDRRLTEFKDTAAAQFKVKDFETANLEECQNLFLPPCLSKRNVYKRSVQQMLEAGESNKSQAITDGSEFSPELPPIQSSSALIGSISLGASSEENICRSDLSPNEVAELAGDMVAAVGLAASTIGDSFLNGEESESDSPKLINVIRDIGRNSTELRTSLIKSAVPPLSAHLRVSKYKCAHSDTLSQPNSECGFPSINPSRLQDELAFEELDEELSDIENDEAVNDLMLTDEEREAKMLMWDELTKDVMAFVHERLREKRIREANAANSRRNVRRKTAPLPSMENAVDSAKAALSRASGLFKNKMNEGALQDLFA